MKLLRILLFLPLLVPLAQAQQQSQCQANYIFTNRTGDQTGGNITAISGGASTSPSFNNINTHCSAWVMTYTSNGLSALSIQMQDALGYDTGPAPFVVWAGVNITPPGTNPDTALSDVVIVTGYYPWINVHLNSSTGTGIINIHLDGYVNYNQVSSRSSSSSSGGGISNITLGAGDGFSVSGNCAPLTTNGTCTGSLDTTFGASHDQIHNNDNLQASTAGSTTMVTATPNRTLPAYVSGQCFDFITDTNNPVTVNIDSLGAKSFKQQDGSTSLVSGTVLAGAIFRGCYDGTVFRVGQGDQLPYIGAATGLSLLVTGIVDGKAPVTVTTGTSATLGAGTYQAGYTFNQEATAGTGVTYTLPATATGLQYCVANSGTTGVINIGVLTVYPPASSYVILNGVVNTVGGGGTHGVASGGAAGDAACFVAIDATHWQVYPSKGTWTAN